MRHKKAIFGALFTVGLVAGCGSSGSAQPQHVVVTHVGCASAPARQVVPSRGAPKAKKSPTVTKSHSAAVKKPSSKVKTTKRGRKP